MKDQLSKLEEIRKAAHELHEDFLMEFEHSEDARMAWDNLCIAANALDLARRSMNRHIRKQTEKEQRP